MAIRAGKEQGYPDPIQSLSAGVALPPPALCRYEFGCSGSRCVSNPARYLCLHQTSISRDGVTGERINVF